MKMKMLLAILLVALAATAILATVVTTFKNTPSITNTKTGLDKETSNHLTLCDEVQPEGKDRGGDWP